MQQGRWHARATRSTRRGWVKGDNPPNEKEWLKAWPLFGPWAQRRATERTLKYILPKLISTSVQFFCFESCLPGCYRFAEMVLHMEARETESQKLQVDNTLRNWMTTSFNFRWHTVGCGGHCPTRKRGLPRVTFKNPSLLWIPWVLWKITDASWELYFLNFSFTAFYYTLLFAEWDIGFCI